MNRILTVLVCGDRNWHNFVLPRQILKDLLKHDPFITVIHGDCRGADKICGYTARQLGMIVKPEPANWNEYGLRAGPIRNKLMIDKYHPDLVIAFHNDVKNSKGTLGMLKLAIKSNIPIKLYKENGEVDIYEYLSNL